MQASQLEPTVYGRYILLNKIAVGGMAEVFRAKSFGAEGFEKLIAIKRLYPHLTENLSFVRMFIDEAKLAATLNHVNTVPISDFGLQDDLYFIAMEYVRGCDLAALLHRCREYQQHIPLGLAVWVLIEICNGLDYAHRKHDDMGNFLNLVHRDITPQNILISYEGEVKITDFGIARVQVLGRDETTGGVLKGKFSYMSPEQVRGDRMDHRSDIFSLGVVAWELLTCQKMFDGPNDYVILEKVREALFTPLRHVNPSLPPDLDHILMKALTRYPEDRYASVAEMRLDLLRFLSRSHLFPSRAHLSAFIRKLFEDVFERDSLEIMEETKLARRVHARQLAAGRPLNTPVPASVSAPLQSNAPSQPIEVFAGATPFSSPQNSPALAPIPLHLQINQRLEHDEPTLPDVQGILEDAPQTKESSAGQLSKPPATLQDKEETPSSHAWAASPVLLEMQEEEDLFAGTGFSKKRNAPLWIGLGTFVTGLLLLFFLARWFLPPTTSATTTQLPKAPQTRGTQNLLPKMPQATVPQRGRVVISSQPWAYIFFQGKLIDHTQIPFEKELPAGTYTIQLQYQVPKKKTEEATRQYKITVKAGKTNTYKFSYP
ncbi:MAG: protein kinase [Myxococcales bacterium]|nr:protein kinase [Myxococcales bacterium]